MALYFECRINENVLLQTFFGDFAHWEPTISKKSQLHKDTQENLI